MALFLSEGDAFSLCLVLRLVYFTFHALQRNVELIYRATSSSSRPDDTLSIISTKYLLLSLSVFNFVLASFPDLGLETCLDGVNGTSGATGFTRHEEDTVLFGE